MKTGWYCKLLRMLLLCLLVANVHAGSLLEQINSRLIKTPITHGEFQQEKQLKVLRKPLISTGRFTYQQHKGVIWQTLTPVTSLLLVNESKVLSNQGEQALPASFGRVFQAMLGGNLTQLNSDFLITVKDGTLWHAQLQPKDALLQKVIQSIELSGDSELRELVIHETNGNQSRIRFSHISHPSQLNTEQVADFERLSP